MSWGDVFFGFRGRINRKIYWGGGVFVGLAGFAFVVLLSYLATGNPFAPEVWERPANKMRLWGPVWLAYFGLVVWPSTALAVKRLHDRDRPVWIWYIYYTLSLAASLTPLKDMAGGEVNVASNALAVTLAFAAGYMFFELGVFRGTLGPNAHGPDPLPLDYYGGDYNFWSWMFALEGRITRSKWWLGVLILFSIFLAMSLAAGFAGMNFLERHPEIQQHMNEPEWFQSKEAQPLMSTLSLWMVGPSLVLCIVLWSALALSMKRLHDRGLSNWLILVVVLPFFGVAAAPAISENAARIALLLVTASIIWSVLQFGILKGQDGPNRHGPDPQARAG
jgi:uncharacterized membrane protein YhaH (DUF805 family)